jgi:hypothetical protein
MAHTSITGSSAGNWFHRLGLIEAAWLDWISLFGAAATSNVAAGSQVPTRLGTIETDLAAGTADYQVASLVQQALSNFQGTPAQFGPTLQGAVQQLLVNMTNLDSPLAPILNVTAALNWLVAAMVSDSATINFGTLPAAGVQTAGIAATPVGNPTFAVSVKDAAGRGLQYVYPETLTFTVTQDAQNGATSGQEPYKVEGQNGNNNPFAWDWLKSGIYGSGATQNGNTLVDPSVSFTAGATGNLLVNGTFPTFTTTNQADNWNYAVGVATTNFTNGTSSNAYFTGQGSLGLLSAGGTKNAVTQSFNVASTTTVGAGGTPYALVASAVNNAVYQPWIAVKLSSGSPANGTLTIDLITGDGTPGGSTVIADDAGTNNTFAIDLTAIADTNWHVYLGPGTAVQQFRLPKALVTGPYKMRAAFTGTILTAGLTAYVNFGLALATQLYAGGIYYVGFRGSTAPNASGTYPDSWTVAITATIGKLQKAMWRWVNPPALVAMTPGVIVPAVTSGSATVGDSLVA